MNDIASLKALAEEQAIPQGCVAHGLAHPCEECAAELVAQQDARAPDPLGAALIRSVERLQAMCDEYEAWIDFYHRGSGDYADFLRSRLTALDDGRTGG